jgi:transcriptional regulator with XRE-family HTH domain
MLEDRHPIVAELRRKRELLKITRAELAARIGVSYGSLANYENGQKGFLNPTLDYLTRWAGGLGYELHIAHREGKTDGSVPGSDLRTGSN